MVEVPTIIIILIGLALIFVIWIEAHEYRKYVKAAKAMEALAAGMQITFEQVAENMSRYSSIQSALMLDSEEKDRVLQAILLVQDAHNNALSINLLTEMAKGKEDVRPA